MINYEKYIKEIFEKMDEDEKEIVKLNIMTIGKTGAGKSTLINSVFGEEIMETGIGTPITKQIEKVEVPGNPVTIYDTRGLELDEFAQEETRNQIVEEINRRAVIDDADERVHMIWYCINAGSNRIEEYEIELIDKMSKIAPVIIVLTQSIGKEAIEFAKSIKNMGVNYDGLISLLAEDYDLGGIKIDAHGLNELVDMTYGMLDEGHRRSFVNAQKVDMKKKADISADHIRKAMKAAALVGATPIPFSDAGVLVPLQSIMLGKITHNFGFDKDENMVKAVLSGVIGMGGTTVLGRSIVANALKFIPGGAVVGGAISGSTAAIVTGALGYAYVNVLTYVSNEKKEGRIVSTEFITDLMSKYFKEESMKGPKLLKGMKSSEEESDDNKE